MELDGKQLAKARDEWLDSDEGKRAADPTTLNAPPSSRQYLENRLRNAFLAGAKAAAAILTNSH
jgi:hypothetical protein